LTHYCAEGTRYCEGVRGNEVEPILMVKVPVGLVEKRTKPVELSVLPSVAERKLL
jgi:hypothetical protein